MIGLILFIGVALYEYHVRGIQAALSYMFGISLVTCCLIQGLPFWICFIMTIVLCVIIGKLPKRVADNPESK